MAVSSLVAAGGGSGIFAGSGSSGAGGAGAAGYCIIYYWG